MRRIAAYVLAALLGCTLVMSGPIEDALPQLPDCDPFKVSSYSGYLEVSNNKSLHYMFVESENDPVNDPVVIWFNGGPGCSSLLGYFQEHGPFIFDDGESKIKPNPEPWNKKANVLYIESPAGVGYSFAKTSQDLKHNDLTTSEDAIAALLQWYAKFPEFKTNQLFISGESYGGIYVPYLAW